MYTYRTCNVSYPGGVSVKIEKDNQLVAFPIDATFEIRFRSYQIIYYMRYLDDIEN